MSGSLPPDQCRSMEEVRAGVDAIDSALLALIDTRFGYMRAAARIKTDRDAVRDERRKAQVVAAFAAGAGSRGLPVDALAAWWEQLVEISIAYELEQWDAAQERPDA